MRDAGAVTMMVGLAGGTGAGKSVIVRSLVERIGGCVIDLESYSFDRSASPGPTTSRPRSTPSCS